MLSMKSFTKSMAFDQSKLRVFFTFLVTLALIFTIYSYGTVSTSFKRIQKNITILANGDDDHVLVHEKIKSSIATLNLPLRSMINEEVEAVNSRKVNPYVAPPNTTTSAERIAWLTRNLPRLEIFKPDGKFHRRVLEFFDSGCEVRVFMTWISPAETFGGREFLAVESLFKAHPEGCLMILSRSLDSPRGYRILKPLIDRGLKVHAVSPDVSFLVKDTPAEAWLGELKRGNRDPGHISLAQNLSNLIRLVVLYKYGGVYLDTDFIVMKPLSGLRNTIGAQSVDLESQSWTRLNNAVLMFDAKHPLLLSFVQEFATKFDGNRWGFNGPYLVSRVVRRLGPQRPGFNFTILPPAAFYPVDWISIGGLFKRPKNGTHSRWVKLKVVQLKKESYGVHLWNKQSGKLSIEEGSVMGNLFEENCVLCRNIYSS